MARPKKGVDLTDVINLLTQTQKSGENKKAIVAKVKATITAVDNLKGMLTDLKGMLEGTDSQESEESTPAGGKAAKPYTGKPRGRKPKAGGESA
jgi:flagellar capping protein FliD